MAFIMPYSLDSGLTVPDSYWSLAQVNISPVDKNGSLLFYCYANEAAFLAGKPNIGQKFYSITPDSYEAFLLAAQLDTAVYAPAYQFAAMTMDVDTGVKDEDGKPIMASFFDSATNV